MPTFIGVTISAFSFIRLLPGDPVLVLAGEARGQRPERHAETGGAASASTSRSGSSISTYLEQLLRGDFGTSFASPPSAPVIFEFFSLLPGDASSSRSCAIDSRHRARHSRRHLRRDQARLLVRPGHHGHCADRLFHADLLVGPAAHHLLLRHLGWTPVSGRIALSFFFQPVTGFMLIDTSAVRAKGPPSSRRCSHLILPTIVLATIPLAVIARQTRSAMLEVLGEDYVRTARAKGLSANRVVGVHALRNALIPVVTTIGLQVGLLMAGAILTETIFSWPGIGKWMIESVNKRDYFVVQSGPACSSPSSSWR